MSATNIAAAKPLTRAQAQAFLELASALSPENLTCDGELPVRRVAAKRAQLQREWRTLEAQVGRSVTENEVWTQHIATLETAQ